jgi:methanogenic corrinoid protein MtbC1
MGKSLTELIADLEETATVAAVQQQMKEGREALAILKDCQAGMVKVGEKFEKGQFFISDLMMSGEIFKQVGEILAPVLKGAAGPPTGKVIVGTVAGDIHDIGKDLVVMMLRSANYEVTDLGVDVPVQKFVEAVKETGATVVGLSCLLTTAFDSMKATIKALNESGLRSKVKVMVGGGPVDKKACEYAGADAWGTDANAAITLCKEWI